MNSLLSLKFLPKKLPNNRSFSLSRHFCRTSSFLSSSSSKIITPHKPTNTNTNTHSHFLSPLQQWRSSSNSGLLSLLSKHAIPKYSASSSAAHFKAPIKAFLGSPLRFLTTRCSKVNKAATPPAPPPPPPSSTEKGSHGWPDWVVRGLTYLKSRDYSWFTVDRVLYSLIFANAAVFTMWQVLPQDFMYKHFTESPESGSPIHTALTYAFSHFDAMCFAINMAGLYIFGSSIGRMMFVGRLMPAGPISLLAFYIYGAVSVTISYSLECQEVKEICSMEPPPEKETSKMVPPQSLQKQENSSMDPLLAAYIAGIDFVLSLKGDSNISAHVKGAAVIAAVFGSMLWGVLI